MKYVATIALMFYLAPACTYAQQTPIKMTFSGTGGASSIDLKYAGTNNGEENLAGNGTLGSFTFRMIEATQRCSATVQHLRSYLLSNGLRRRPFSLPGWESDSRLDHARRRLHRFCPSVGPLYLDLQNHRRYRPLPECIRRPDADGDIAAGIGRQFQQSRVLLRNRPVHRNDFRTAVERRLSGRSKIGLRQGVISVAGGGLQDDEDRSPVHSLSRFYGGQTVEEAEEIPLFFNIVLFRLG